VHGYEYEYVSVVYACVIVCLCACASRCGLCVCHGAHVYAYVCTMVCISNTPTNLPALQQGDGLEIGLEKV